jgi:hypothetical protein
MKKFLFLALLLFVLNSFGQNKQTIVQHVVLIGIDGMSAEAFQLAPTPNMDELVAEGAISLKTRGVMPTVSAPNWATILSGAGPEQHGVTSNKWSLQKQGFRPTVQDKEGYFTSIFTIIRQQRPLANTAMFFDWEWLGTYVNKSLIDTMLYAIGFQKVTDAAASYIVQNKPYFTFIYYGHPDETGHEKGFNTSEYYQATSETDAEIGRLVDSIKYAGIYSNTVIIITSDHGGKGYGHGGESMIELEVPWIILGPGIRKNIVLQNSNDLANTSPTIASLLGLSLPPEWTGRPMNEAFVKEKAYTKKGYNSYVPKPFCSLQDGIYLLPQPVTLASKMNMATIHYTLDGSIPDRKSRKYQEPILLATPLTLTAMAFTEKSQSEPAVVRVNIVKGISSVKLASQPSAKYPGQGAVGLVDGNKGSEDYTDNAWMGYEGNDFEAVIDFGRKHEITRIGIAFLQQPANWIFLPDSVTCEASADGVNYELIGDIIPSSIDDIRQNGLVELKRSFSLITPRFLRIKAKNIGTCPEGHPGAGQKAWMFISEITIE